MDNNYFSLGDIQVSPSHNELLAGGNNVKLQPKAMAVLVYLALNHKRVVSNEELIQRLWEGRVVTHGSVQKSINTLRGAFSVLMGEQEVIAHYSKRGYQLKIAPIFNTKIPPENDPSASTPINPIPWFKWLLGLALISFIIIFAWLIVSKPFNPTAIAINKHHKTLLQSHIGYTNETGHERNSVPHPDNNHVAYIRETFNVTQHGETNSEIFVRNKAGKDWRVAKSHGSWFKLAWSPSGTHLVAIEVKRAESLPLNPNFFEKPNYLYTFHIFTLDLEHERLVEKQLLSQWQGRIFSVTWWDENTLEFVGQQGANGSNLRYRYSTLHQQLSPLDEIEGVSNPVASSVLNKRTALASTHKHVTQIDFLNEDQSSISRWQLNLDSVDISWIPDGSGILIYADDERKLLALYLDGTQQAIPFPDTKDSLFSRPRFSSDGNSIFYTEEKLSVNIMLVNPKGAIAALTHNTNLNYAAAFSPNGEQVVYASVRNNQTHLWLISEGQERQLTTQPLAKKVGSIIWAQAAEQIVFNAGNSIYQHNIRTGETSLLLNDDLRIEPISFTPESHRLVVLKSNGDTKNLWRMDTQNKQQRQLTFGSVGSAIEYQGNIYFQYIGEHGLWVLHAKDETLEQLSTTLTENSKLLLADAGGIYFVDGGKCRESDLHYFDFKTATKSIFIKRESNFVSTSSFHPLKGVLETECYLPESNIMLMQ